MAKNRNRNQAAQASLPTNPEDEAAETDAAEAEETTRDALVRSLQEQVKKAEDARRSALADFDRDLAPVIIRNAWTMAQSVPAIAAEIEAHLGRNPTLFAGVVKSLRSLYFQEEKDGSGESVIAADGKFALTGDAFKFRGALKKAAAPFLSEIHEAEEEERKAYEAWQKATERKAQLRAAAIPGQETKKPGRKLKAATTGAKRGRAANGAEEAAAKIVTWLQTHKEGKRAEIVASLGMADADWTKAANGPLKNHANTYQTGHGRSALWHYKS